MGRKLQLSCVRPPERRGADMGDAAVRFAALPLRFRYTYLYEIDDA